MWEKGVFRGILRSLDTICLHRIPPLKPRCMWERERALLDAVAMLMLRGSCLPSVKTNAGWISQGTVPWEDMNRPQTPPKTSSYCSWSLYHQCRCLCSSPTPTARAKLWTTSLSLNTSYTTVWHKHKSNCWSSSYTIATPTFQLYLSASDSEVSVTFVQ